MTKADLAGAMQRTDEAEHNGITAEEHLFAVALNAHTAGMQVQRRALYTGSDIRQIRIMAQMLSSIPAPSLRVASTEVVGSPDVQSSAMLDQMKSLVDQLPTE